MLHSMTGDLSQLLRSVMTVKLNEPRIDSPKNPTMTIDLMNGEQGTMTGGTKGSDGSKSLN